MIRANLERTHLADADVRIVTETVARWLGNPPRQLFDIAIVDPPYDQPAELLEALRKVGQHLETGGRVVAKHGSGDHATANGRAASIGARAPVRRDHAHVLPASGGAMSVAVYPGSFDPVTNGHLDILSRAATVFDRVIVGVLANPRKTPLLSADVRMTVLREAIAALVVPGDSRIEVAAFDGLTVDFGRANGATAIVRGLRAISDFETEMQLAHNNRVLAPDIDTVFFMTSVENGYVSSSLVKEIAGFGGDVSTMVPAAARIALGEALARR